MNRNYLDEEKIYKKMYYRLFNAVTDAIQADTKSESDLILKNAQKETEDIFISGNAD